MGETARGFAPSRVLVTYDEVASEYYNQHRHPTCANFRDATAQVLEDWLAPRSQWNGWICEVGAGKSLLAHILSAAGRKLSHLVILDASRRMLAYSSPWKQKGANLMLGRANALPLRDSSITLLAAPVSDPFNEPRFWSEADRVLHSGATAVFTTP